MIKKLTIKNFQSHKNSELEFHKGMNVIVGNTDTGKSAIIRSLNWVNYNSPSGDDFRSDWGGDTKVIQELDSGDVIERVKGKENLYVLNGTKLKSFKTNVPDEVKNVVNISEVNLQGQHDSIYLISNTPGEVAKHFNRIAKIDKIDSAIKKISSDYRKVNQTILIQKEDLQEKETLLSEYSYLEKAERDINELGKLQSKTEKLEVRNKGLHNLIFAVQLVELEMEETSELKHEGAIDVVLGFISSRQEVEHNLSELQILIDRVDTLDFAIGKEKSLNAVNFTIDKILDMLAERGEIAKKQKKVVKTIQSISEEEKEQKTALKSLEKLQKEFDKHMTVCPLCNTKLK